MERITNIMDAKKKMQASVEYYQTRIEAWEKVKRVYKKDGGNFASLARNFENAKIIDEYPFGKRIFVYFQSKKSGYENDYITIKGETPEGVQEQITALINNYKKWLEIDTRGLAEIETQINNIMPALDEIKKQIEKAKEETNTHYTLRSFIKSYLEII